MKLVFAIIQDDDFDDLHDSLMDHDFHMTKLNSTGAFLGNRNVTLMIGTEDNRVDELISIIKENCHSREEIVAGGITSHMPPALGAQGYPLKIRVGGAILFVTDVERFEKI